MAAIRLGACTQFCQALDQQLAPDAHYRPSRRRGTLSTQQTCCQLVRAIVQTAALYAA